MITPSHLAQRPLGAELVASVAVNKDFANQMDLMMGIHPQEKRALTELEERAGNWVSLLAADSPLPETDDFTKALAVWRDNWPNWVPSREGMRFHEKNTEERWRFLLPHCSPVAAAYLFRPIGPRTSEEREIAERDYRDVFHDLERRATTSRIAKGCVTWTTSFFPSSGLRQVFEELCGLTESVKDRLGLDDQDPGFLRRYVTAHEETLEDLVKPNQFEHLVADVYRAEGWECRVTRYSKDGGIDIEASRVIDDAATAVLIQVKRNRSKMNVRGSARPVGLDDVKAFAATVRAEGKDTGVLVSSSHFTRDAVTWASTKGQRVANVSFVNGTEVRSRLCEISRQFGKGEIASYILATEM